MLSFLLNVGSTCLKGMNLKISLPVFSFNLSVLFYYICHNSIYFAIFDGFVLKWDDYIRAISLVHAHSTSIRDTCRHYWNLWLVWSLAVNLGLNTRFCCLRRRGRRWQTNDNSIFALPTSKSDKLLWLAIYILGLGSCLTCQRSRACAVWILNWWWWAGRFPDVFETYAILLTIRTSLFRYLLDCRGRLVGCKTLHMVLHRCLIVVHRHHLLLQIGWCYLSKGSRRLILNWTATPVTRALPLQDLTLHTPPLTNGWARIYMWLHRARTVAFLIHLQQRSFSLTFFYFRGLQNSHPLDITIVLVTCLWQNERLLLF